MRAHVSLLSLPPPSPLPSYLDERSLELGHPRPNRRHPRPYVGQPLVGRRQPRRGGRCRRALGGDDLHSAKVGDDVGDPRAQARRGRRLGADAVGRKLGVGQVVALDLSGEGEREMLARRARAARTPLIFFSHLLHRRQRDVVLVEGEQRLEEGVHVAHVPFGGGPGGVLRNVGQKGVATNTSFLRLSLIAPKNPPVLRSPWESCPPARSAPCTPPRRRPRWARGRQTI